MYRYIDGALLRAAVQPVQSPIAWPDLTGDSDSDVQRWRTWLTDVWSDQVAAAVELASPVLASRIREVRDGRQHDPRDVRGMVLSMTRYLLRMTSRATPFGLFAGVAPVSFDADATAVRWGDQHRAVARPDSAWLVDLCNQLERVPQLFDRLLVLTNDLCFVRGDQLVVPHQPHSDTAPADVSVRYTRAVATIVTLAGGRVAVADLVAKLATDFPGREAKLRSLVAELVTRRVLLTNLRPPMTAVDPVGHVLEQLRTVDADDIPEVSEVVQTLHALHADLSKHNTSRSADEQVALRASAARHMARVAEAGSAPLAVDLALDCRTSLPAAVVRRAEQAADLLARLDPQPRGSAAWRDYHGRFLDRYGPGAVVPIRDLVSDAGLGYPAGYRSSRYEIPAPVMRDRDHRLLALAQQAAMAGDREVVLDERAIADLQVADPDSVQLAPHTELGFQVLAGSRDDVDWDDFDLLVTAAFRTAGSTAGRFLHLLGDDDYLRVRDAYRALPAIDPNAMLVQLSSPPVLPRPEHLARVAPVLQRHTYVGEHPVPELHHVPLDDLAVTADAQRLQLVSLHRERPVEFMVMHALEFTNATHPMVRLLCEISRARTAGCHPFDWGAASRLPFLPRIRHGRTVLSAARWNLTAADLPGPDAPWNQWRDRFASWTYRVRLPEAVYVGGDDRRIRLDLREDLHVRLLREHLERYGHATLREAPDQEAFGWIDGRAHEIVVPLVSTRPRTWPALPAATAGGPRTISRTHGEMPGSSRWLQVKLYGHPDRHPEILTGRVDELPGVEAEQATWWFLRYRDPEPHLRLRIALPHPSMYGTAAQQVSEWANKLRAAGLISHLVLDPYSPEIGRFGPGRAMNVAEQVFVADSRAAVAQLTASQLGADLQAVTAASLVNLAVGMRGDITDGMNWLVDHVNRRSRTPLPRDVQREATRLADPTDDWAAVRALPGGQAIADAWAARRLALAMYRQYLSLPIEIEPDAVLASLLHLHHVRVAGIDADAEALTHRLARAAALSLTARNRRTRS